MCSACIYLLFRIIFLTELDNNMELNEKATSFAYLPNGTKFRIENFHYNNSVIVMEMTKHLQNSSFPGLSVSV